MREIRTSGSEGGGAGNLTGPPYPYRAAVPPGLISSQISGEAGRGCGPSGAVGRSPGFQPWVGVV